MQYGKMNSEFQMILLLADTKDYTIEEVCKEVGISRRSFYYYLAFLRENGFMLYKNKRAYHIDRRSPFVKKLIDTMTLTDEEVITVRKLLDMVGNSSNVVVRNLRAKLDRYYDFQVLSDVSLHERASRCVNTLYDAIKGKMVARIVGYSSPHSHTVNDRLVEPFLFLNNNQDIRCYELSSGVCKTFKIARMEDVKIVNQRWTHDSEHRRVYTDLFMFSSEDHYPVELRLGQLAHNLLLEEYPQASASVIEDGTDHWLFQTEVCSYAGIGRFVIGLFDDIEILKGDGLKQYVKEKIESMHEKCSQ